VPDNIVKEESKKILKERGIIDQITNRDIVKAQANRIKTLESTNNELEDKLNKTLELLDILDELEKKLHYFERQVYRGKIPKEYPKIEEPEGEIEVELQNE
jgi:hypothetical protein